MAKAAPAEQLKLLELQGLDAKLKSLFNRRRSLESDSRITDLEAALSVANGELGAAKVAVHDAELELKRAEADVEQVASRIERDEAKLNSGTGLSKDLVALQRDLVSLNKRRSDLEDVELEVLERLDSLRLRQALNDARRDYDIVVVDTPPVLAVGDAVVLTRLVDGMIVVAESGRVTRRMLTEVRSRFEAAAVQGGRPGAGGRFDEAGQLDRGRVEPPQLVPLPFAVDEHGHRLLELKVDRPPLAMGGRQIGYAMPVVADEEAAVDAQVVAARGVPSEVADPLVIGEFFEDHGLPRLAFATLGQPRRKLATILVDVVMVDPRALSVLADQARPQARYGSVGLGAHVAKELAEDLDVVAPHELGVKGEVGGAAGGRPELGLELRRARLPAQEGGHLPVEVFEAHLLPPLRRTRALSASASTSGNSGMWVSHSTKVETGPARSSSWS